MGSKLNAVISKKLLQWIPPAIPLVFLIFSPGEALGGGGLIPLLHLFHLLMAGAAVYLLFLIGHMALDRAGLLPGDYFERILLAICTGFFVLGVSLFLLASAGALRPWIVWPLAVLAGWFSKRSSVDEFIASDRADRWKWEKGPVRAAAIGLGVLFVLLFGGSLLEALIPSPHSPDALAHNLAYARLFAESGGLVFTTHSPLFFAITGYWEFFLASVALFVPSDVSMLVLAQLFHLILGLGGTALGIVCLVRRLSHLDNREALALGIFGAVLFAGMRIDVFHVRRFPLLIVAPKSDLFIVALQAAGALAFFESMRSRATGAGWALLGGLLLGAASGVKLTAGLASVALGVAFMIYPPEAVSLRKRASLAGWAAAGLAIGLAPMLAKNALALGNPIYPLMTSYFGTYENPEYLRYVISGFRDTRGSWLDTGWRLSRLIAPSAAFATLLAGFWPGMAPRGALALFLAVPVSIAVSVAVFSGTFPTRYALFITAFAAACAACLAGALIDRLRARLESVGDFPTRRALPAAWILLFTLAALPTHLDNRLKRAFRTAGKTTILRERVYRMNPVSRFQAGWKGRLPEGARPMTFYRPERLFAVTRGWLPVVAVESPSLASLFLRESDGPEIERALFKRGITHVYFGSPIVPPGFPLDARPLASHLRNRPPLWRESGIEMYALSSGKMRKGIEGR